MIIFDDRYGYDFSLEKLEKIKENLTDKDVELIFMDNSAILEVNAQFRGSCHATDVLSFPLEDMPNAPLGSIIISIDKVKQLSFKLGHSESDELCLLFIHGLLHLLGYDHQNDNGKMRELEKNLIEDFNLPKSLILRSE